MTLVEILLLAETHGRDAADHLWQVDPAEEEMAAEWVRNAEAGTMHDYLMPSPFEDMMQCDLDTEGWSWSDLAEYGAAWEAAYIARTTDLMREVLRQVQEESDALRPERTHCPACNRWYPSNDEGWVAVVWDVMGDAREAVVVCGECGSHDEVVKV